MKTLRADWSQGMLAIIWYRIFCLPVCCPEIYRTVILPVVSYRCEAWSLTMKEEQRMSVFKNTYIYMCVQEYIYIYTYVYWTVHHLDSWVKRAQLDATCFIITLFSAKHVSDVNTSILRSLRLSSDWVVLQTAYEYHTTIATLQRNTNTHRTRYNPWSNFTN